MTDATVAPGAPATLADPTRVVWLAPPIFAAHWLEEAPGFVAWFNELVDPDITATTFAGVNATALTITVVVTLLAGLARTEETSLLAVGWLSLLMLANGLFHLIATLALSRYSPGTWTAATLYLPFFAWFTWLVRRRFGTSAAALLAVGLVGAAPMVVHGYLIVARGSRLF